MSDLNPQQIVAELDRYIVGQSMRNVPWRLPCASANGARVSRPRCGRRSASKNILVIGPTGVGKTELARRLARLVDAPFLKTEATKFTEVGYVGRDVESIVRDLADASVSMVHHERMAEVRDEAEQRAVERIVGYLVDAGKEGDAEGESRPAASERAYLKRQAPRDDAAIGGARAGRARGRDRNRRRGVVWVTCWSSSRALDRMRSTSSSRSS